MFIYTETGTTEPLKTRKDILRLTYYCENGGTIVAIGKKNCGHHPHGLEDNTPIIEFVERHSV